MSFTFKETTLIRGGQLTLDFAGASDAKRTFTVTFSAQPTTLASLEAVVGAMGGLPALLSALPGDTITPSRKLQRYTIKPNPDQTRLVFDYEAEYQQSLLELNPWDEKDLLSFEGSKETEEYFMDESDPPVPVVNSAYETFEKLPERTTGSIKLVVEGNRQWDDIDLALYASYLRPNSVNDAAFVVRGKSVGYAEAKMTGISVTPTISPSGALYGKVRWEMEAAPDWFDNIEDRGFNELPSLAAALNGQLGYREIVKGVPPVKVDKPAPLDGDGHLLAPWIDDTVVLQFRPYPKKDFSVFGWTTSV